MSKVVTIARLGREFLVAMMLVAFIALTSGCGGSDSAASVPPPVNDTPPPVVPPPPPPPAPAAIEGVATPTSVAVVTATNAQ